MPWDRSPFYDRDGQPISALQWEALRACHDYYRVALTERPHWVVSTVWIGIDMGFRPDGPPIIFETMVFGGPLDCEQWRYATEVEAHAAHEVVVAAQEAEIRRRRLAAMRKRKRTGRRSG